jgi:hypothetical protein
MAAAGPPPPGSFAVAGGAELAGELVAGGDELAQWPAVQGCQRAIESTAADMLAATSSSTLRITYL